MLVRASTVLGSWALAGLVPSDEIIEGICMKGPHWRVEEEDESSGDEESDEAEVMDVEST